MEPKSNANQTLSHAHPETMDFLSKTWCNFAVQAFQPDLSDRSIVLHENPVNMVDSTALGALSPFPVMRMEDTNGSIPPWKSNNVKSWIWMQQAMHPELNYNQYYSFRKKWFPWKMAPLKNVSIKKWLKEIKDKRKEDKRMQRAEIHAAISVAGIAAALAAVAADGSEYDPTKEAAVASAAALVAAQCAQFAEAMGAKRDQLSSIMSSAMSGTSTGDILTLTAAAATSLRGAAALKARSRMKTNRFNTAAPILPIEEKNEEEDHFEFDKCRAILGKGSQLNIQASDGRCKIRTVSIVLSNDAKVILKIWKPNLLNAFTNKKQSIIVDIHAELYRDLHEEEDEEDDGEEAGTCYLIVVRTNRGSMKLDMMGDYQLYKMWASTINHMLMLSTSFTKYDDLQYYK
ncbi:VAN3-binding protein [Impatiens glandulifera]|uniref:VAN3-binding protein n=1 Tax=Impatiens glandulifera TaxID=253017 RepID=UPI001FB105AF|nr:VAN3-binding protein [Impatiens glandulifera]